MGRFLRIPSSRDCLLQGHGLFRGRRVLLSTCRSIRRNSSRLQTSVQRLRGIAFQNPTSSLQSIVVDTGIQPRPCNTGIRRMLHAPSVSVRRMRPLHFKDTSTLGKKETTCLDDQVVNVEGRLCCGPGSHNSIYNPANAASSACSF